METKTHGQFDARYSYFSSIPHLNSLKNNTPKFSKCRSSLRMPVSNSSPSARLNDSKVDASWSHIPLVFIRHLGGPFLFECNYDIKYLNLNIPIDFYKDALLIWHTMNQHAPQTKEQILEEIIWNNRFIKIKGLYIY